MLFIVFCLMIIGSFDFRPVDARSRNYYFTTRTVIQRYMDLAARHPDYMSYEVIGQSVKGRDIPMFKVGNPEGGVILMDGRLHGNEDAGTEAGYAAFVRLAG